MAGLQFVTQSIETSCVGTTETAVIQVSAAANHPIKLLGWGVFFDGTSVAAEPVQVKIVGSTVNGTFTNTLTGTAPFTNGSKCCINGRTETIQSTGKHIATGGNLPTEAIIYASLEVHPQSGYEARFPLGQEPIIAGAAAVSIVVLAPATVNCRAMLICEE
jgi:hypothetical protein